MQFAWEKRFLLLFSLDIRIENPMYIAYPFKQDRDSLCYLPKVSDEARNNVDILRHRSVLNKDSYVLCAIANRYWVENECARESIERRDTSLGRLSFAIDFAALCHRCYDTNWPWFIAASAPSSPALLFSPPIRLSHGAAEQFRNRIAIRVNIPTRLQPENR